ncbi:MAG TPA: hypothetical protein VFY16_03840 [Gemmatimonadaceae bacterium]|nr:hypothetical protein [Gemmatimonadaceae bacterium]
MSERNRQHHGRSAGDDRVLPGRDLPGEAIVRDEVIAQAEDAREITRLIDESEGYTNRDPYDLQHGEAGRGFNRRGRRRRH